ncbi:aspartate racemase/maleate isomerase family protein [Sapientia aquatica]|uniref:aspartate racemase/maleate isomerase family protein n=1 Tax=Sapientia aquatica TaxID=1549640 RepID=UPI0014048F71|nr:hypothetical protein [Sapientia aquatica]
MKQSKPINLGILAAPCWMEPTGDEIRVRHPEEVRIAQTIMGPIDFDYSFPMVRRSEAGITAAAKLLAAAGSELILQVGPAFTYQIGQTMQGVREFSARLTQACGVKVILNGVAVLDLLASNQARKIAIACPYYNEEWKAEYRQFFTHNEFEIITMQSMLDQGSFKSQAEIDARQWNFSAAEISSSVYRTAEAAPQAEAIIVTGAGARTLSWIRDAQQKIGKPVISADYALYHAFAVATGLTPRL